jgi:hypothetical protein
MVTSPPPTGQSGQFNDFLRCALWLESDAAPLSVLSALARLDLDPWEAAAQLAELPESAACAKLSSMLADLPGAPAMRQDREAFCARSVRLLPRVKGSRQSLGSWAPASLAAGRARSSFGS